jgi:hypothetical protein
MKVTVFWDFVACGLIEIDRRLRDVYCPVMRAAMMTLMIGMVKHL